MCTLQKQYTVIIIIRNINIIRNRFETAQLISLAVCCDVIITLSADLCKCFKRVFHEMEDGVLRQMSGHAVND